MDWDRESAAMKCGFDGAEENGSGSKMAKTLSLNPRQTGS